MAQRSEAHSNSTKEAIHYKNDQRKKVGNTMIYPHNAIGRISIKYFQDNKTYCGTAFLADDNILITAAHNVRKPARGPARTVHLRFGVDYPKRRNIKTIKLRGRDFTVPKKYSKPTDQYDIAMLNMEQYLEKKTSAGISLDWSLSDLPSSTFRTCDIPGTSGIIPGDYLICGMSKAFIYTEYFNIYHV